MSDRIRTLELSDVPQGLALSQAVGWDQTASDWELAIDMGRGGCFAVDCDGAVVATTTSIRYGGELAWIGMVLTHPEFRGRGFARSLVRRALEHLRDVKTIKLDATEMGVALYRHLGFVDECAIERWRGQAQATPVEVQSFSFPAFDQEAFGAIRGKLLTRLATVEAASLGDAFAMGRGNRFGPCVSQSKESALMLAQWYLARHPNERIVWDLFPENNIAEALGFRLSRRLTRMRRGPELREDRSLIYAGAGFEFG